MTIIIGSMMQETNSFSPVRTSLKTFSENYLYHGDDITLKLTGTRTEIGGFIDVLNKNNQKFTPSIAAMAIAGGKVTSDAFHYFKEKIISTISQQPDIKGILLALHGAMLTENNDDPEGELLTEIREIVGTNIPIAISLDPHAHVTKIMQDAADIIVGYKTFPHIDHYETGELTAKLLLEMLSGKFQPIIEMIKIPMLISPETQADSSEPMSKIIDFCNKLEKKGSIKIARVFPVQPWLDVPGIGTVAMILSNADREGAKEAAKMLANEIWNIRNEFVPSRLTPEEAIDYVSKNEESEKPFILSESSDSTLAGAPGDCVFLLKALYQSDFKEVAYVTIIDPIVVENVFTKSVGDAIKLDIGHHLDSRWGKPLKVSGVLELKSNGEFLLQQTGVIENMGRTVVVKCENIYIVVCENSFAHMDPNSYSALGLNPIKAKVIGVKSTLHFRAFYEEIASEIILLETPGVSNGNFIDFEWKQLQRPYWPLDNLNWKIK